ncbi:exonuclease [Abalone shriveling syndrome-associated virus]|uniref:exonuclease n=1 Tax=Abalone shriveling syndrome-associated virus TaxID=491893 RepID=UPI0001881BB7|nr:exonuclease [Abalone shriveling syndrome-associated virus]ACJ71992.1 exonuclease [Abalone shriveling syndrome-associated virus]
MIKVSASTIRLALANQSGLVAKLRGYQPPMTDSMKLGSLAHATILEPEKVNDFHFYSGTRSGKAYKALAALGDDKMILPAQMHILTENMKNALHEYIKDMNWPQTNILLQDDTFREKHLEYHEDDLHHRGVIDAYSKDGVLIDYKTTADAGITVKTWEASCARLYYHIQMAYYGKLLEHCENIKVKDYIHVVQSTAEPYLVFVFKFSDSTIEFALQEIQQGISTLRYIHNTLNKINTIELDPLIRDDYLETKRAFTWF